MKHPKRMLVALLVIVFMVSMCAGRYPVSLETIVNIFNKRVEPDMAEAVFLKIRLPRITLVMICGGALSLAGFMYQSVFQNPLVSGDVLGVTQGCSVGAILALLLGGGALSVQLGSFAAGILTVAICIKMAGILKGNRTLNLILVGIVVGALANAMIMMLKMGADPYRELPAIEFWLMGSFSSAKWTDVVYTGSIAGVAFLLLYHLRYQVFVLSHGEEEAAALGIEVKRVRLLVLAASTVLISSVISVAGIVSWVGLIAPHLVRLLLKQPLYKNMGSAVIGGSFLLLTADTLARSLWSFEMPISILTSIMGALFLWYLLSKRGVRL